MASSKIHEIWLNKEDNPCACIKSLLEEYNTTFDSNQDIEITKIKCDNSIRPLNESSVNKFVDIMKKDASEFKRYLFLTPTIGYKEGGDIYIVDGNQRFEAMRRYNNEDENCKKTFRFSFLINGPLNNVQKLTLISVAEQKVCQYKTPLTKFEIIKHSRELLLRCPEVLGINPLSETAKDKEQKEYGKECVKQLKSFFHIHPSTHVFHSVWKATRINDEDFEKIYNNFEQLPPQINGDDFDVIFNAYPLKPQQIVNLLTAKHISYDDFRKTIRDKTMKNEIIPLLKHYNAYLNGWSNEKHFDHIAKELSGIDATSKDFQVVLADYVTAKRNNINRNNKTPQEKLDNLKQQFPDWYNKKQNSYKVNETKENRRKSTRLNMKQVTTEKRTKQVEDRSHPITDASADVIANSKFQQILLPKKTQKRRHSSSTDEEIDVKKQKRDEIFLNDASNIVKTQSLENDNLSSFLNQLSLLLKNKKTEIFAEAKTIENKLIQAKDISISECTTQNEIFLNKIQNDTDNIQTVFDDYFKEVQEFLDEHRTKTKFILSQSCSKSDEGSPTNLKLPAAKNDDLQQKSENNDSIQNVRESFASERNKVHFCAVTNIERKNLSNQAKTITKMNLKSDGNEGDPCKSEDDDEGDPCKGEDDDDADPCEGEDDDEGDPCKGEDDEGDPCKGEDDDEGDPCKGEDDDEGDPCEGEDDDEGDPCKGEDDDEGDPCKGEDDDEGDPCKGEDDDEGDPCKGEDDDEGDPCKGEDDDDAEWFKKYLKGEL